VRLARAGQGRCAHVLQVNCSPLEQHPLCTSTSLRAQTKPWLSVSSHLHRQARVRLAIAPVLAEQLQGRQARVRWRSPSLHRVVAHTQALVGLRQAMPRHIPARAGAGQRRAPAGVGVEASTRAPAPSVQLPDVADAGRERGRGRCGAQAQRKQQRHGSGAALPTRRAQGLVHQRAAYRAWARAAAAAPLFPPLLLRPPVLEAERTFNRQSEGSRQPSYTASSSAPADGRNASLASPAIQEVWRCSWRLGAAPAARGRALPGMVRARRGAQ